VIRRLALALAFVVGLAGVAAPLSGCERQRRVGSYRTESSKKRKHRRSAARPPRHSGHPGHPHDHPHPHGTPDHHHHPHPHPHLAGPDGHHHPY